MIAIARISQDARYQYAEVLECPDVSLIGIKYILAPNDDGSEATDYNYAVIKFDPQDQFCKIFPVKED